MTFGPYRRDLADGVRLASGAGDSRLYRRIFSGFLGALGAPPRASTRAAAVALIWIPVKSQLE
jgi:hypothetical protein